MINDSIMTMNNNGSRLPTLLMTVDINTIGMMPMMMTMMPPIMVPIRRGRA